jgi:hypothetical protein
VLRKHARPTGSRADPRLGVVEVYPYPVALDEVGRVARRVEVLVRPAPGRHVDM